MTLDLILAIFHHILVFALFGILFAEFFVVRAGIGREAIVRIARIDLFYGLLAGLIIIVGFSRAIFAAKGWAYYQHNLFFWAKIATFVIIGLLSVPPTLAYVQWRRVDTAPTDADVKRVRFYLHLEVALFPLLLIFAAAMARGYGEFH
jgi:putative membrane protein